MEIAGTARLNTTSEVVAKCRRRFRLDCVEGLQDKPGARVACAVSPMEDLMEPWQHRSWGFPRHSGPWRVRDLRRRHEEPRLARIVRTASTKAPTRSSRNHTLATYPNAPSTRAVALPASVPLPVSDSSGHETPNAIVGPAGRA